jgi:hypothetical protein
MNFLPSRAVVVDPSGTQTTLQLPQVAPGRYEASMRVQSDGVYTLTAIQTDANGGQAIQSSGFVVPYSPEYGVTSTDRTLLDAIARRTGGKIISNPGDAFAHTLPSVGSPQPLWPLLMVLLAVLLVADVGVRRVRIATPELRTGYGALRRRLGYVDERPHLLVGTALNRRTHSGRSLSLVTALGARAAARGLPPRAAASPTTHNGRLLAAKHRAARR